MKTINHKTLLLAVLSLTGAIALSQSSGEIRGLIKDTDLQPVPFATIKVLQSGQLLGGAQTDEKGRYSCKPLNPGTYEMMIIEPGHQTQQINKIKVAANEATYVDVKLTANTFSTIEVMAKPIDYTKTGVDITMFNQISVDATELNRNAGYTKGDIKGALESVTSDVIQSPNGEIHFRGSRGDASGYFVDGVRTLGSTNVPGLALENLSVFPGGVPAMYGDLSSGVVIITTKSYFSGLREKNIRKSDYLESKAEEKAQKQAKEDEEKRAKEIEEEKKKEKETKKGA